MLDTGLSAPDRRPGRARPARRDAGRGHRRVRPQPAAGREHLGQRQQRRRPRPLAVLLHRPHRRRRHQARLRLRQERRDRPRPRSKTRSIRPSCWRRSITPSASTPDTIVYNHLNQPRELVKAKRSRSCSPSLSSRISGLSAMAPDHPRGHRFFVGSGILSAGLYGPLHQPLALQGEGRVTVRQSASSFILPSAFTVHPLIPPSIGTRRFQTPGVALKNGRVVERLVCVRAENSRQIHRSGIQQ